MFDYTVCAAVDGAHLDKLAACLPTWRDVKGLGARRLLLFADKDCLVEAVELAAGWGDAVEWNPPGCESQREKMLSAFVFGAAQHVKTSHFLKLDSVTFAEKKGEFLPADWADWDMIGQPWGYTKPGHWIEKIDWWLNGLAKDGLAKDRRAEGLNRRIGEINAAVEAKALRKKHPERWTEDARKLLEWEREQRAVPVKNKDGKFVKILYYEPFVHSRYVLRSKCRTCGKVELADRFCSKCRQPVAVPPNKWKYASRRVCSWIRLLRTDVAKKMADVLPAGRMPVPSEDTFIWRWCERLGLKWMRWNFAAHGWNHSKRTFAESARKALEASG